jgi:L-threonylcarbamoyladenylate synthase
MDDIAKAVEIIQNGGVILYPTDTIWGIGCDPTNEKAIKRIIEIKKRSEGKSFVLLADTINRVERYVKEFPEVCYDLVDLATEPLTIVYPVSSGLSSLVCGEDGSVAFRVTADMFCRKLIQHLKKPIVSTSANISGEAFPTRFQDIAQEIIDQVDFVLHNPDYIGTKTPSKIIKFSKNGNIELIRR